MDPMEHFYIDEETIKELVILRKLASAHRQMKSLEAQAMSGEQGALISHVHQGMRKIMEEYDQFFEDRWPEEGIGIIVGRFQVPELHDGHKFLLETVKRRHICYGVAIGVANDVATKRDPLTYHMRAKMINDVFLHCITFAIKDYPTDKEWSEKLDEAVRLAFPVGKVRLYGARDSFIPFYEGQFPTSEITAVKDVSATEVRQRVGVTPSNHPEFLKGLIFATQQQKEKK